MDYDNNQQCVNGLMLLPSHECRSLHFFWSPYVSSVRWNAIDYSSLLSLLKEVQSSRSCTHKHYTSALCRCRMQLH